MVALKTQVRGNRSRSHRDIEPEHILADGKQRACWETEETTIDPVEYELAIKVRSKVRSLIRRACIASAFGFLCPIQSAGALDAAITEARRLAAEFNAEAQETKVVFYVILGQIAADDVEALKAINSEVRDLLARMSAGIRDVDVEAIRDSANKARALTKMLAPEAGSRIEEAVNVARDVAKTIKRAGDRAATIIDEVAIDRIDRARTAFLDLEPLAGEIGTPAIEARALDFGEPEPEPAGDPSPMIG
jgi:hypothetical protein